ncbi:uroporphyrinogen-III synthase [Radiobacillus deserti]|uniref:Uroporphyrinogen-III synthase n=1 Tax=Radiobacillus deserti TaxID=2594883 RepID=A0A516KHB2_9BACI|nr:uroporphyrinogen-III synthase [Radiobacillus deserti]QDP40767.1 uroporphyrinogen-III synthase [Radiobacillus deserti]
MSKPLLGKHILITRSKEQAPPLVHLMERAGAIPVVVPLLTFKRIESEKNRKTLQQLHEFTWVFFTSANGVKFFFDYIEMLQIPQETLSSIQFAVVGKKTEQVLQSYGYRADFQPSQFDGNSMAKQFVKQHETASIQILLINGNLSKQDVQAQLEAEHIDVEICVIYETIFNVEEQFTLQKAVSTGAIDAYTFTSPSTVQAFCEFLQEEQGQLEHIKREKVCVCIGTTTEQEARKLGFTCILVPEEFTIDEMVRVLEEHFSEERIDTYE